MTGKVSDDIVEYNYCTFLREYVKGVCSKNFPPRKSNFQISPQVEAQNQVVRKLEEKERLLQTNLMTVEKELAMRQQAMEMHKR